MNNNPAESLCLVICWPQDQPGFRKKNLVVRRNESHHSYTEGRHGQPIPQWAGVVQIFYPTNQEHRV